jgi:hypothetical protein
LRKSSTMQILKKFEGEYLKVGDILSQDFYLASKNQKYSALFQNGVFLVMEGIPPVISRQIWQMNEAFFGACFVTLPSTGGFNLEKGVPGASVRVAGMDLPGSPRIFPVPARFAVMEDDGNFCIYVGDGPATKGTRLFGSREKVRGCVGSYLIPGDMLVEGEYLRSINGQYSAFVSKGVFTVIEGALEAPIRTVWSMKASATGECSVIMQKDGNFCMAEGKPWASTIVDCLGTTGPTSFAWLQNDGNFCIYRGTNPNTIIALAFDAARGLTSKLPPPPPPPPPSENVGWWSVMKRKF